MEVIDKRKLNEELPETEPALNADIARALSDIPRVYEDPEPLADHLLVKQAAAETYYKGTRFVIPETAQQSPNEGVVVAVGPDIAPEKLVPGDLIVFGRFNAEPIEVGGELFQLVSIHDVKLRRKVVYAVGMH
jgi:co-chaperonin GroES (HSP10)